MCPNRAGNPPAIASCPPVQPFFAQLGVRPSTTADNGAALLELLQALAQLAEQEQEKADGPMGKSILLRGTEGGLYWPRASMLLLRRALGALGNTLLEQQRQWGSPLPALADLPLGRALLELMHKFPLLPTTTGDAGSMPACVPGHGMQAAVGIRALRALLVPTESSPTHAPLPAQATWCGCPGCRPLLPPLARTPPLWPFLIPTSWRMTARALPHALPNLA